MSNCYLDTSALAKWYINEPGSEAFEQFVRGLSDAIISRLTATELRCLLARRRRGGEIGQDYESKAFASFEHDIAAGHLRVHGCHDAHFVDAVYLINRLDQIPLRTLDAIHLAIALDARADTLATADKVMARAAEKLDITVCFFGDA
ncbi:MAG TPA: PIN domain-containing protein [Alphaproteobacteria bacterium]|nr:PIN domain-containing protein [Alphaproteobacteria bacterium]